MDELLTQIEQMKQVLSSASEDDKPALMMMISQLEELANPSLTQADAQGSTTQEGESAADDEDEFHRFQKEIAALEDSSSQEKSDSVDKAEPNTSSGEKQATGESDETEGNSSVDIQNELSALEGMKCKAPHEHHWGQVGYHNAIVLNVEHHKGDSLDGIMVRVLFSQPVAESMLPCKYFMEGRCRFEDDSCKYSHGEVVSLSDLREYSEPDFSRIKSGSRVLAKYTDGLWYKATVTEVLESGECKLKYDSYEEDCTLPLHETTPMYSDDEGSSDSSDSDDSISSSSDESDSTEDEEVRDLWMFHQMKATGPLGEWEKHTKGIGSKLMAKMGYVVGTGLGPRGEGRVEPVDAVVLPPGRSLDACMELKEKAGDGNLFSAEKRLKRLKRKQEQQAKREEEKQKAEESLFAFLNTSLSKSTSAVKKDTLSKKDLSKETTKNLNKKILDLGETIKQVNSDIAKYRESIKRHQGKDEATAERFRVKLEAMEKHLNDLKQSEQRVISEQRSRSDSKKLTIF